MKRVLAALIFFTRLPFWRIANIDKKYYQRVVPLWPLAGWLTGGIMAGVFYLSTMLFDINVSIVLAIISRILVTGALHEDGFADFCDGFGGGSSRERILAIMKDSHIGTYGVLGLLIYFLLFFLTLTGIWECLRDQRLIPPPDDAIDCRVTLALLMVSIDTMAKYLSSTIIYSLPYARKESEAKNKLIYVKTPFIEKILSFVLGIFPIFMLFLVLPLPIYGYVPSDLAIYLTVLICSIFPALIVRYLLFRWMRKRIQGYTGDCCGATFIIIEIVIYLTLFAFLDPYPLQSLLSMQLHGDDIFNYKDIRYNLSSNVYNGFDIC